MHLPPMIRLTNRHFREVACEQGIRRPAYFAVDPSAPGARTPLRRLDARSGSAQQHSSRFMQIRPRDRRQAARVLQSQGWVGSHIARILWFEEFAGDLYRIAVLPDLIEYASYRGDGLGSHYEWRRGRDDTGNEAIACLTPVVEPFAATVAGPGGRRSRGAARDQQQAILVASVLAPSRGSAGQLTLPIPARAGIVPVPVAAGAIDGILAACVVLSCVVLSPARNRSIDPPRLAAGPQGGGPSDDDGQPAPAPERPVTRVLQPAAGVPAGGRSVSGRPHV